MPTRSQLRPRERSWAAAVAGLSRKHATEITQTTLDHPAGSTPARWICPPEVADTIGDTSPRPHRKVGAPENRRSCHRQATTASGVARTNTAIWKDQYPVTPVKAPPRASSPMDTIPHGPMYS